MFTTIGLFADPRRICRFAASVTALLSVLCLLDASFLDGFTNTLGRAATLLTNPNVAALSLLIGGTGTIWSLTPRWRVPFIVLVGGAVFATLSRSSMFIGALVCLSTIPLLKPFWHQRATYLKSTLRPTLITLLLTISLLVAGFINNSAFGVATGNAFEGLRFAVQTLQEVKSKQKARGGSDKLNAITASMVSDAERENSASARAILLERAWQSYRHGPAFGQGLEKAFSLAPHNTQLLMMVAFGNFGWVVVPLLIALIFCIGGWRKGLPPAVAVAGGAFFSHDLLLAVPLIASLVVLLIGLRVDPEAAPAVETKASGRTPMAVPVILLALASLAALYAQSHNLQNYRLDVQAKDINGLEGPLYYVILPDAMPKGLVRLNTVDRDMQLTESSRPLAYSNEFGGDQDLLLGFGQYSVRNMWLWFVPGDGSDPALNGRTYRFSGQVIINPEFVCLVLAVLLWAASWVYLDRRIDVRK
ncbi:O-antigen ligase family protein [Paraburkholderia solisilvae]|nr:O-antigen ligase family protein [Paraburkholderia solisilvae]